jgi:hypothetical protein
MTALLLETNGTIKLPTESLKRYGFEQKMPIRLIETKEGVLLVPITNQPMSNELSREIAQWQEASSETWEDFSYETK